MTIEINRERFAEWLRGKGDEVVGQPGVDTCCPIAKCLVEHGSYRAVVGMLRFTVDEGFIFRTPDWASAFIRQVDGIESCTVTGSQCLKVLESLEA